MDYSQKQEQKPQTYQFQSSNNSAVFQDKSLQTPFGLSISNLPLKTPQSYINNGQYREQKEQKQFQNITKIEDIYDRRTDNHHSFIRPVQQNEQVQQKYQKTEAFQNVNKMADMESKVKDLEAQLEEKNKLIEKYRKQQNKLFSDNKQLKHDLDHSEQRFLKLQKQQSDQQEEAQNTPQAMEVSEKMSFLLAMKLQERDAREIALREQYLMREQAAQRYHEFMQEAFQPMQNKDPNYLNTDNMSYEQLLELQDKVGHVSRGLKKEQIKMIPKILFRCSAIRESTESCSICCSNFLNRDKCRKLKCNHTYHSKCIKQWLNNEKSCPICKLEVQIN